MTLPLILVLALAPDPSFPWMLKPVPWFRVKSPDPRFRPILIPVLESAVVAATAVRRFHGLFAAIGESATDALTVGIYSPDVAPPPVLLENCMIPPDDGLFTTGDT